MDKLMGVLCWIGLHKYEVLRTTHEGGVHRGLLECKRCRKKFHALSIKKYGGIMPLGEMAEYWGLE